MKQLFLVCMTTVCLLSFQTIQGQQVVPAQGAQMIPAQKMQMTLAQPDGIAFRELSFANALKMAKEENKLLFVDCFTTWCGPCRMLSKVVFKDSLVADYFNRHFVNLKMDMEKAEARRNAIRKAESEAYAKLAKAKSKPKKIEDNKLMPSLF